MQRPSNKQIGWGIVAVGAILATLFFGVNYPVPPAPEPEETGVLDGEISLGTEVRGFRPVQIRALNVAQDLGVGGDATITDDLTAGGDVTITGGLSVTGGVTGTNVLTTGNQTIAGVKTFSTSVAVGAVTGPVTITGPTAVATATPGVIVNNLGAANNAFEVRDAATPVFVVRNGGAVAAQAIYAYAPVTAKIANYTVSTEDTGAIVKSSGSITMTLPGAVAGLNYCIVNYDGGDLTIEFTDATDVALNEVNSPGDRVTNTTAYDLICLAAIDATNWMTISSVGTWSDGN